MQQQEITCSVCGSIIPDNATEHRKRTRYCSHCSTLYNGLRLWYSGTKNEKAKILRKTGEIRRQYQEQGIGGW